MKANLKTWPATPVEASPKISRHFKTADLPQLLLSKEEQPGSAGHPESRGQRSEVRSQIGTLGAADELLISEFVLL